MVGKKDGTLEHTTTKDKEDFRTIAKKVFIESRKEHGLPIKYEIKLYQILIEEYQKNTKEQEENSGEILSKDDKEKKAEAKKNFINNHTRKFKERLEKILYKGVTDCLKKTDDQTKKIVFMIPREAKESALFLMGLGNDRKKYQKELTQLENGEEISSEALHYISYKIQQIFKNQDGMALDIQYHINTKGFSKTKQMRERLEEFSDILSYVATITDIEAGEEINSAMNKCIEIMKGMLVNWSQKDEKMSEFDEWIRNQIREEIKGNLFWHELWKNATTSETPDLPDNNE